MVGLLSNHLSPVGAGCQQLKSHSPGRHDDKLGSPFLSLVEHILGLQRELFKTTCSVEVLHITFCHLSVPAFLLADTSMDILRQYAQI